MGIEIFLVVAIGVIGFTTVWASVALDANNKIQNMGGDDD